MKKTNQTKREMKKPALNNKEVAGQIENLNESSKEEQTTDEKFEFPVWTRPEHLDESDHDNLKRFYELFIQEDYEQALCFASDFDTIVREAIPDDVWEKSGGKLRKIKDELHIEENVLDEGSNSEETPETIEEEDSMASSPELIEIKFNSEKELEQFVAINHKVLFGEKALFFKSKAEHRDEHFPDTFLIDFTQLLKPRLYLIESIPHEQNFGQCFVRMTHLFALLRNKNHHGDLCGVLQSIIESNKDIHEELLNWIPKEIALSDFLVNLIAKNPLLVLLSDGEIKGLPLLVETYVETWGQMLKTSVIRKFAFEDTESIEITPAFVEILKQGRSKPESVTYTEEDHLEELPLRIRLIYGILKKEMLSIDSSLEFNPKKHYISVRKSKNLAFFHLRRKNIDLVIMNPEEDTRKLVQSYRIKTLPASVQKFWNGACCTIVIENGDNLGEVIDLLKGVVEKS